MAAVWKWMNLYSSSPSQKEMYQTNQMVMEDIIQSLCYVKNGLIRLRLLIECFRGNNVNLNIESLYVILAICLTFVNVANVRWCQMQSLGCSPHTLSVQGHYSVPNLDNSSGKWLSWWPKKSVMVPKLTLVSKLMESQSRSVRNDNNLLRVVFSMDGWHVIHYE